MVNETKMEESISATTEETLGVPVVTTWESTEQVDVLISFPRPRKMPSLHTKLSPYLDEILWIVQNLPSRYLKRMMQETLSALKKAEETQNYDDFEQILGDWEFTARIESTPELKQGLEESAKRAAIEKTVSLEEILGRIQES